MAEESEKKITCLGENTEKYITFTVLKEKKVTRTDKNGEELQKMYLTFHNLLIAQYVWQAPYQILSIVILKEFKKINVNTDMIIKNVKIVELSISITTVLNQQTLKII